MKKVLISVLGLGLLAGCNTYDYYEGGVKYVQDGPDCIYYSGEQGKRFNNDIYALESGKKVVYRDTICKHLYEQDTAGQASRMDRTVLAPAAVEAPCAASKPVFTGCRTCTTAPVVTRKYYTISAM